MRKSTILGCLALAAAVAVAAGAAETKKATHTHSSRAMKSLTGCLEKGDEPNTFKLTHITGGADYELVGAPASLKMTEHLGHKVEVSGTAVSSVTAEKIERTSAKEPKETKAQEKKEMKDEKGEKHLKVAALKHIAPTCP